MVLRLQLYPFTLHNSASHLGTNIEIKFLIRLINLENARKHAELSNWNIKIGLF
jgi:hypothetical protein